VPKFEPAVFRRSRKHYLLVTAVKQLSAGVPAGMVLASCSVMYTQSYVRCPTTILSDLAWPCTVSLSAYFASLARRYFSVLLPASPHSRKCCLGCSAGMGRWLTHADVLVNCTRIHEELVMQLGILICR